MSKQVSFTILQVQYMNLTYFEKKNYELVSKTSSCFSARNFNFHLLCLFSENIPEENFQFRKATAIWRRQIHSSGKQASVTHQSPRYWFWELNHTFLLKIRGLRTLCILNQWNSASPLLQYDLKIQLEHVMCCLWKWIGFYIYGTRFRNGWKVIGNIFRKTFNHLIMQLSTPWNTEHKGKWRPLKLMT